MHKIMNALRRYFGFPVNPGPGEERCYYCEHVYPAPVSYHHTHAECLANQTPLWRAR